jgi:hypothetical protein
MNGFPMTGHRRPGRRLREARRGSFAPDCPKSGKREAADGRRARNGALDFSLMKA